MKKLILSLLCILTLGLASAQSNQTQKLNYTCMGTAKSSGQPCKMKVSKAGEYCRFHNPNAIKCSGTTKAGAPCKMQVNKQGDYCHYHSPIKQ